MSESTQPPATLESAPAALQDAPSEFIAIEKAPVNGGSIVKSPPSTTQDSAIPTAPTKSTTTVHASAPVQTTTGEPNGTNDASVNGTNGTSPSESDDEVPLFSPSLISPEVSALLPEGYTMRPLRRSDYNRGTSTFTKPSTKLPPDSPPF